MAVRFSLHSSIQHLSQAIERACQAEALGYEAMFIADSHMDCMDPFQILAVCAGQTKRLRLGTAVTNMVYRDPTVLGGLIAQVGDTVIDGSVKSSLAQLKTAF